MERVQTTELRFAAPLRRIVLFLSLPWLALNAAAALTVSSNFENASARVLAINPETQTVRLTPAGNPDRGWPCWWYARVDGVDPTKPLTLEVDANTAVMRNRGTEPKALSANWSLPARAVFSTNRIAWQQTDPGVRKGKRMVYRIQPGANPVWVAWGPPFTWSDARAFVGQAKRSVPFAKALTLTRSKEGREVPALQVCEGLKPASERPAIWVLARQHAWEAGGTWVAIGFTQWLMSDDDRAKRLRNATEICIVPIMDVDHVVTGDGGKQCIPQDHNQDWSSAPHWPEVAAVQQRMSAVATQKRLALVVDLHNPGSSATQIVLWTTPTNYLGVLAARNQEKFCKAIRDEVTSPFTVQPEPHWDGPGAPGKDAWRALSCPWIYEHGNPHTVAITIETPWNMDSSTEIGYREAGRKLGWAMERYFRP